MKFRCYLCGSNSADVVADKKTIRFNEDKLIVRCKRCDLIQMTPRVEPDYTGYGEKKDFDWMKRKRRISRWLPKVLGEDNKAKKIILEVGCGYGDNMEWLYDKGFHTMYGIDKDPSVCKKASVHNSDWRGFVPSRKPDIIYSIHFFEHVAEPKAFLMWMRNTAKVGGKMILEVPCVEDPLIALYKNEAYNKFCWYPYHIFFYSKQTLGNMLCGLRYKIKRRQEYGLINHLRWAILRRPGNWNPHIPVLDDIYKFILARLGYSDSLVAVIENV